MTAPFKVLVPETVKLAVVPSASPFVILFPEPAPEISKLATARVFLKSKEPDAPIVNDPVPRSPLPETLSVPADTVVPLA